MSYTCPQQGHKRDPHQSPEDSSRAAGQARPSEDDRRDHAELGPGAGRVSTVRIFNGPTLTMVREFTVFDPTFLGGVFVGGN